MSSLVRYWVVNRPSKVEPGVERAVAHFRVEAEANKFLASEYFKSSIGVGTVDMVSFEIYDTAEEAESNSIQKLRESGLSKLKALTQREAVALGIAHILNPPPVPVPEATVPVTV